MKIFFLIKIWKGRKIGNEIDITGLFCVAYDSKIAFLFFLTFLTKIICFLIFNAFETE